MSLTSPDQVFDELLVMRYQAGDQKALELLIKRWNPKIMRYAYRYIQDQQSSEDVAQEVWIAVIKGLNRLTDSSKFGSWLLGITHNKAIDWIKKNATPSSHLIARECSPMNVSKADPKILSMRHAIKLLTLNQRNVLTLFYLEGHSIQEISEILNISVGTVKSRLFYARESLKQALNNTNYE